MNKGFQAIAGKAAENTKKAFEDSTRTFEQLMGAKSFQQAIEIQSQYAKRTFDNLVADTSKLAELYGTVVREASKPIEQAFMKKTA